MDTYIYICVYLDICICDTFIYIYIYIHVCIHLHMLCVNKCIMCICIYIDEISEVGGVSPTGKCGNDCFQRLVVILLGRARGSA